MSRARGGAVPHILHLQSTFAAGGKELRTVQLINAFGKNARHSIVSAEPDHLEAAERAGVLGDHQPPVVNGRARVVHHHREPVAQHEIHGEGVGAVVQLGRPQGLDRQGLPVRKRHALHDK